MRDKWDDIMDDAKQLPDERQLMDYLEGRLNAEEKHRVEKMMATSGFLDDAVEGLGEMKDKQRIAAILQELNGKLHQKTQKKRKRFNLLIPDQQTLTIVAIVTILILVLLGFVLFKMASTTANY
jgi:anti-sigma factor RsiW